MQAEAKILRIITRLNIGGPSFQSIFLTERLNSGRFQSLLVCGIEDQHEGSMHDLADRRGVNPVVIPHLQRGISLYHDLAALIQLYVLIKQERPHVVHTHTSKAGTLGRIAAWLAGVPVIIFTLHGSYFHNHFSPMRTKLFTLIDRLLAIISSAVIAVSKSERQEILEHKIGNEHKVINVPLGLELDDLLTCEQHEGTLRAELGIEPSNKLIGIIARLSPIKGHRFFLDAAKLVLQSREDVAFLIIGDGELRHELEEYTRSLGIGEGVIFLGFRRDLPVIYADLDMVVLSSLNEGLPVAVIEGMAAAKPIVATRVGGVAELLDEGKSGVIVSPSNPEDLARGIIQMLDDPDMGRIMGESGRRAAMSRYRIDILTKNIVDLYQRLLKEKGILIEPSEASH